MNGMTRARDRRARAEKYVYDEVTRLDEIVRDPDATVQAKTKAEAEIQDIHERESHRRERLKEVEDAYRVISAALNGGRTDDVRLALASEHSTLLGQLWNAVTDACEERVHDGRVEQIAEIVKGRRNPFI